MADETTIGISVAFDVSNQDMDRIVGDSAKEVERRFGEAFSEVDKLTRGLQDAVRPMAEIVKEAEKLSNEFKKVKEMTDSLRENTQSLRTQYGMPIGSINQAFGGMGQMLGMVPGMHGLMRMGGTALGIGGLGIGTGLLGFAGNMAFGEITGDRTGFLGRLVQVVHGAAQITGARRVLSWIAPDFISRGEAAWDRYQNADPAEQAAANVRMQRMGLIGAGIIRGIGQGPLGMFANISGTVRGYDVGRDVAAALGGGDVMQQIGGFLGASFLPGMIQNYAQEAMSRYPGYLQTAASMASVAMYGGNLRQIRALRPAQWGYGPGEIGPEFGALYRGFGGTGLTSDALRTAMAYSRLYGVGLGEIGQAVGGLVTVGGGGQFSTAVQNEQMLLRVMTDAVSAGFGRRLPEYAQAVGSSVQSVLAGPALIGQDQMAGLTSSISMMTGLTATTNRMGLGAAGRLLAPLISAPQNILEGMFSGRGSPFQMAMYWGSNRQRFGNDPMRMMEALERQAATPFSAEALEFQRGPLEQILRSAPNAAIAVQSIRELMPNISFTGARQVYERGMEAVRREGGLGGADMRELFTGVEESQVSEAEQTRETMRQIQTSGERIMNDQLRAMRANAQFAEAQFGISAAMAKDAAIFHRQQIAWTRVGIKLMQDAGIRRDIEALGTLFDPAFMAQMEAAGESGERVRLLTNRILEHLRTTEGLDLTQLAESMGITLEGRGVMPGQGVSAARPGDVPAARRREEMIENPLYGTTPGAGYGGYILIERPRVPGMAPTIVRTGDPGGGGREMPRPNAR